MMIHFRLRIEEREDEVILLLVEKITTEKWQQLLMLSNPSLLQLIAIEYSPYKCFVNQQTIKKYMTNEKRDLASPYEETREEVARKDRVIKEHR
ncbi:MAG: hypothetical protein JO327_05875 [Nitrososphaeraceae archaeon]|nr:hypothetical protein [Nitrososphaeraceae archaeon]